MLDFSTQPNTQANPPTNPLYEFRNETGAGADDGTPVLANMVFSWHTFILGIMLEQGEALSNVPESTVSSSPGTGVGDKQVLQFMEEYIRPTGQTVVETPLDTSDPATFNPYSTYSNVSVSLGGGGNFMRVEGGNAASFGGFPQLASFASHTHGDGSYTVASHNHGTGWFEDPAGGGNAAAYGIRGGSSTGSVYIDVEPNAPASSPRELYNTSSETPDVSGNSGAAGDIETRPDNTTVRLWRKTATVV